MKLVLLTNIPTPYRNPWFDALASVGHNFEVLYLGPGHPERRKWNTVRPDHPHKILSERVIEHRGYAFHPAALSVWNALNAIRPDAVLIGGWDQIGFWIARAWCQRHGVPWIPSIESHGTSGRSRDSLTSSARRRFLRGAPAVMAVSAESERFVRDLAYEGPVYVVSNPAAIPVPRQHNFDAFPLVIGFAGELSERKNPLLVLDILEQIPVSASARFAGAGPLLPELTAQASERGLDVSISGFIEGDELEDFWAGVSVLVLPSRADPAPLVLSEAAIRGIPFVASDRCGSAETLIFRGAAGAVLSLNESSSKWGAEILRCTKLDRACTLDVVPWFAAQRVWRMVEELAT
jgi:glycosyltransferase involved in cell wall biosynthesis